MTTLDDLPSSGKKPDWDAYVVTELGFTGKTPEHTEFIRRRIAQELELAYQLGRNHGIRQAMADQGLAPFEIETPGGTA